MTTKSNDQLGSEPNRLAQRRNWVLGAGAVGVAAVAVKALPGAAPLAPAAAAVTPVIDPAGGYQLTAHVQRYYETAKA